MIFDANIAQTLTLALTNLNTTLTEEGRENKSVNYLTFSEQNNEDVDDFIIELKKAFAINRMPDNRKYIVIASCLKGTAANFYNRLVEIIGWNVAGQLVNTQLRPTLIAKFQSEAQATYYYN